MKNLTIYENYENERYIYKRKLILPVYGTLIVRVKNDNGINMFYISSDSTKFTKEWTELPSCAYLLSTPFENDDSLRRLIAGNKYTKTKTVSLTLSFLFNRSKHKKELDENEDYFFGEYEEQLFSMYDDANTIGDVFNLLNKLLEKIDIDLDANKFGI